MVSPEWTGLLLCRLQRPAPRRAARALECSGRCQGLFACAYAPSSKSSRAGAPALLGQVRSRARFVALPRNDQVDQLGQADTFVHEVPSGEP